MPTMTIEYRDDAERLALEQAIAYVGDLHRVAQEAPDGTVLTTCEQLALGKGRDLLRSTLSAALTGRITTAEQKGGSPAPAPRRTPDGRSKGEHSRTIVTAIGRINVCRTYFTCSTCNQGEFGADRILGIDDFVTLGARRVVTLLGTQQSFARAEFVLSEVTGWELDDNTIRKLCHDTAKHATSTRDDRATAEGFAKAKEGFAQAKAEGERRVDTEIQIDAGKVNTLEGWRDVKAALFACRERATPTTPSDWDERELKVPSVRSVVASIEEVGLFGPRCGAEAKRLGLTNPAELTVLGDGAEWLWNLADREFVGAKQVLDYWHGTEYLDVAAKAVYGADSEEAKNAFGVGKGKLLADGYWGVTEWIGEMLGQKPVGGDGASLGGVLNYFCGHQDRLNYAARLRRGQSIGSGMVEGSIKQLLNKRLKQTGARWKVEHVGPLVEFGALVTGPEWQGFWENY